jgi:Acetyltransferase (GNAT) domain
VCKPVFCFIFTLKLTILYTVKPYIPSDFDVWNNFVAHSKNGTFLFHRNFMEYHSDRFTDCSLMVFEGQKPVALLPAHKADNTVYSHQGLTYGGLILGFKIRLDDVLLIFKHILKYYADAGFKTLYLKCIPYIYHKVPAQEIEYALFTANASLVRRDAYSVLEPQAKGLINRERKRSIQKGRLNGLTIKEGADFRLFWEQILLPNLLHKHDVKPVHTVEEMELLHSRFPDVIRQFNVFDGDKIVGGVTVFIMDEVIRPQYISGNADKNRLGSLDFLYDYLINERFTGYRYFDFGPSNELQGRKLNTTLAHWKESYGARTVTQDFYEVQTVNHTLLDSVFI